MRRELLAAGIISALTLIVYSNSFSASFHFDDAHQIVSNPHIRRLANLPGIFRSGELESVVPGATGYRPVNISSFALNYAVSGYNVWSYHLLNILLHICNALLVYALASMLLPEVSLASSVLFALHPVQTNAVTYVSGRSAVLSAFFCLLGIWLFVKYRSAGSAGSRRVLALSALAAFGMGLLSKETGVVLLGLMLAYDLAFYPRTQGAGRRDPRQWLIYLPFLAVLALYLLARELVLGRMAGEGTGYGHWQYIVSESKVLLLYVRLLLLPFNQNADYSLPLSGYIDLKACLSFLLTASSLYLLYRLRAKEPAAAFFGFWFLIGWAPESTLTPIKDLAVEYRMYLPSIGFITLAAFAASRAIRSSSIKKWAAALIIVVLSVLSFNRNEVWADDYALWRDVVKKSPHSARAYHGLGDALLSRGEYREAEKALETALAVDPRYGLKYALYNDMGFCKMKAGDYEAALKLFGRASQTNPERPEAYHYMGLAYYSHKRYQESEKAYLKAIALNPAYADAHSNLGLTYGMLGRYADAVRESEKAAVYDPKDFAISYNLAVAYYNGGMAGKAMERARITLGLAGDDAQRRSAKSLMAELEKGAGSSEAAVK